MTLHKAYSNGRYIFLDLKKNKYSSTKEFSRDLSFEKEMHNYRIKLQENIAWRHNTIPSTGLLLHFIKCFYVASKYKKKSIKRQIALLRLLKTKKNTTPSRVDEIYHYCTIYQNLRNLRLHRPVCLEDSICCFLFLEAFISPLKLVLGVQQPPFAAHAWVQCGDIIMNDRITAVQEYSPILEYNK